MSIATGQSAGVVAKRTLDLGTIQALADPQMAAHMYSELLQERDLLANELAQLQPQLELRTQVRHPHLIVGSSSLEGLIEGLSQLQELSAAAAQELADILSSASSLASSKCMVTAVNGSTVPEDTEGLPRGRPMGTLLQPTLLSRLGAQGDPLLSWGSGASDAHRSSSDGCSGAPILGLGGASTAVLDAPAAPTGSWHEPSQADSVVPPPTASTIPEAAALPVWGSGVWVPGSGMTSLRSSASGSHELATNRLSRLAVGNAVGHTACDPLWTWGPGLAPNSRNHIHSQEELIKAMGQQEVAQCQHLAATQEQVRQLQDCCQRTEKVCQQSRLSQQVMALQQFAHHQEHVLALADQIIRCMQIMAQSLATAR